MTDVLNPIARLLAATNELEVESIVRVDLCSPFIDPDLIDGLIMSARQNPTCDFIGYRPGSDATGLTARFNSLDQMGLFGEWCKTSALQSMLTLAQHSSERDQLPETGLLLSRCLLSQPDSPKHLCQLRLIPVPPELERDDLRLRLSQQEDWDAAEEIIAALDPEELSWHGVTRLLDGAPEILTQMRNRNAQASRP